MKLFFGAEMPKGKGEEYKDKNYQEKEPREHDHYANPLEGAVNVPGKDVVDPENYYNEVGFEDHKFYNDVIDSSSSQAGGEILEMKNKYGLGDLEDWEFEQEMKKCEDYQNGKKIPIPFSDENKVRGLAAFYREYLTVKNEHGLPFSQEELSKVSAKELDKLADLHEEQGRLIIMIAELNQSLGEAPKSDIVYSTKEKNSVPGNKSEYLRSLKAVRNQIASIEGKISDQEPKIRDNNDKNAWKDVPKYSPEELALRKSCFEYFKNRRNPRPTFIDGKALSEAQILEVAQEAAADENWPKGNFFVEEFKGRRQLSCLEKLGGKTIKYTFSSATLPAGRYFFEADPNRFFINQNNKNFAVAPISLMITGENPKRFLDRREADKRTAKVSA